MVILQLEEQPLLVQAIFSGNILEVRNVLRLQLDVNLRDGQKRSPLHAVAFLGDTDMAALLLQQGACVNAKDVRWITPLHRACCSGSARLVSLLLKCNANSMARDKHWQTPLHVAAANNALECIEQLLTYVSNLNITDRMGRTALHHAAVNGHNDVIAFLIRNGCIVNVCDKKECCPLHYAAQMGHLDVMKTLLANGADINVEDRNRYSPLHAAAASGMVAACQILIKAEANVNAPNAYGSTPLHTACLNGHINVCRVLVSCGADLEATNFLGQTALHISAAGTHAVDCLNYLVKMKADINKQSLDGRTPLHMTAIHGRFTRSKTLIDNGAVVDTVDKNGCTALHIAAHYGHDLLANTLLLHKADPFKKGHMGRTPLHVSCLSGYVECCRKFLQVNVEINAQDDSGMTPLHCAAYKGSIECLDLLVSNGARFEIVDNNGRLPLHYAAVQGHYQCVYTLLTLGSSVNTTDSDGCSPLHLASWCDTKGECVKYLLRRKANPQMKDLKGFTPVHYAVGGDNFTALYSILKFVGSNYAMYGSDLPLTTPLHLAARNGNHAILELLLSYFHDVNIRTQDGSTALLLASKHGHTDCVQLLLRYGARVSICDNVNNMSPIHYSSRKGHKHTLALLLDNTDDDVIDLPDSLQRTALMLAVSDGNFECANMLLKYKANPNLVDSDKHSSIFRAVVNFKQNVVQLLMAYGARVDLSDIYGKTILHLAAAVGNIESLQVILDFMDEKDVVKLDNQQLTALHWACYRGNANCVEYLLTRKVFDTMIGNVFSPVHCAITGAKQCLELLCNRYGPDIVNLRDARHRTPLHIAALNGQVECAKYLLEKGAEVDCKDINGRTPLIAAAQNGQTQILDLFFNYKSDVTLYDHNGNTALHLACLKKYKQSALLLLKHITDSNIVNMVNNERQTPLHLAARNGLVSVTHRLIKKGSSVLALDINGMTPALCCAPNQSVAQCLAIILSNYLLCSSQDQSLNVMFQKIYPPQRRSQVSKESQTCVSLLGSPDALKSREPDVASDELSTDATTVDLCRSNSNVSLVDEKENEEMRCTIERKRRPTFTNVYKLLKKVLRELPGSQATLLKQEQVFDIVQRTMKSTDAPSEDEMRRCVKAYLDAKIESEVLDSGANEPKLKVIETANDDDVVKVDAVIRRERSLYEEAQHQEKSPEVMTTNSSIPLSEDDKNALREGLDLIGRTKDLRCVNNEISAFEKLIGRWPDSVVESMELMKQITATLKEQEWLERVKDDLEMTLEQLQVPEKASANAETQTVRMDVPCETECNRIISGVLSEVEFSTVSEEIKNALEGNRYEFYNEDVAICEGEKSDDDNLVEEIAVDPPDNDESPKNELGFETDIAPQKLTSNPKQNRSDLITHTTCNETSNSVKDGHFSDNEFY